MAPGPPEGSEPDEADDTFPSFIGTRFNSSRCLHEWDVPFDSGHDMSDQINTISFRTFT